MQCPRVTGPDSRLTKDGNAGHSTADCRGKGRGGHNVRAREHAASESDDSTVRDRGTDSERAYPTRLEVPSGRDVTQSAHQGRRHS